MIDTHTHCYFSADSNEDPKRMLAVAQQRGLRYLAITDHLDFDRLGNPLYANQPIMAYEEQFATLDALSQNTPAFVFAHGVEVGYSPDVVDRITQVIASHPYDIIINSVHTQDHLDYCHRDFAGCTRDTVYREYLEQVLASTKVPYTYHVVAHIGYVARYTPFDSRPITYREFPTLIDAILTEIICHDACLEINTRTRGLPMPFLPGMDIVARYRELGGENISFASDSHEADTLGNGYDTVVSFLRTLGYNHFVGWIKGQKVEFPF